MGTVKGTWLLPAHSGRPCHHENIYTKMNKKTGKCYSVKLCNPNDNWTANQTAQRNNFGLMNSAISLWINQNKVATATDHSVYQSLKTAFDRQSRYSSLRGYMMAKNMAVVQTNGSVTITIGTYTATVTAGVVGGGSTTQTQRTLTLNVSPAGAGTVTGAGQYAQGASANISAVAATGYTFSKWSDDNTNATRSVTVNSDMSLTAQFTSTGGGGDNEGGGYA